jgi:NADH-quinone oxidoreductase subunit J
VAAAFYIFAFLSVLGGILMVTRRNPLSSAFALVLSLVSLAALYAGLAAEFLFILQVLVYAGAIMVLVIFTIMLLNLNRNELYEAPVGKLHALALVVLCAVGLATFMKIFSQLPSAVTAIGADFGSIEGVGGVMLTKYLYPFELVSALLLVAIVGVVLLAKKVI